MKRVVLPTAVAGLALALAPSAAPAATTIRVTTVQKSFRFVDKKPAGRSPGDSSDYREKLFRKGRRVGQDRVRCVDVRRRTFRCTGTYTFTGQGTIRVSGLIHEADRVRTLSIVGGTDLYMGARGSVRIQSGRGTNSFLTFRLTQPA